MRAQLAVVATVFLIVLAGCGGGGGGGEPDPGVSITNAENLKHGVEPGETPTVYANTQDDDDVTNVTLSYQALNRSGEPVTSDRGNGTIEMTEQSDDTQHDYAASLPSFPAGYTVEYEVTANYSDEPTQHDSDQYTVSYVKRVDGPTEDSTTADFETSVGITLTSYDDVKAVVLHYEQSWGSDNTQQHSTTVASSPYRTDFEATIDNTPDGASPDEVSVTYWVTVKYGTQNVTQNYTTKKRTYTYKDAKKEVLYIPVTFSGKTEQRSMSTLQTKAEKVKAYYTTESRGSFVPDYKLVTNDSQSGFFVLDGAPNSYRYEDERTYKNYTKNGVVYNKTIIDYKYDRKRLVCQGYSELDEYRNIDDNAYAGVGFVHTDLVTRKVVVRNTSNGSIAKVKKVYGTGRAYTLGSANDCGVIPDLSDLLNMRKFVVSTDDQYGTWAHELGHARFEWDDYYNPQKDSGEVGMWGLMGSGSNRRSYPSQVMGYHKWQRGWVDAYYVTQHSDENRLEPGESETVFIPYAKSKTDSPSHKLAIYTTPLSSVFNSMYQFEAREPPNAQLPERVGRTTPANHDQAGLVAYGVTVGEEVNLVQNQDQFDSYPIEPTIDRYNYGKTFKDPSIGLEFSIVQNQQRPADEGLTLQINRTRPTNLQGINVFTHVKCDAIGGCDQYTNPSLNVNDTDHVGVVGHTDDGRIGVLANGTEVNEVPGATVVDMGQIKKIYVPKNYSVQFTVDTSQVDAENGSVVVESQTVTRTENGTRVASEIENDTVEAGTTTSPELARLELSMESWQAGDLRTLESNQTTLGVSNTGIANLTNVSVSTDASWLSVNETDLGTLEQASLQNVSLRADVPGGKPVGTYEATVTVTGNGTNGVQRRTVNVTVTVMPTVHWTATTEDVDATIATNDTVATTVVVRNNESSNVPMHDVATTVTGNVTRFDVTTPPVVETLEAGENTTLTTTISVPEDGIEEGTYTGTITVETMEYHQRHYEYPVDVPQNYRVARPGAVSSNVTVDAIGPSAESSASFNPDEQVAMRKGSTTETITVDPVASEMDVPAETVAVNAPIPDGWEYQRGKGNDLDRTVSVWVVTETAGSDRGNSKGKRTAGERVKLAPDDYTVELQDDTVVVRIPDVRSTEYGEFMTAEDSLAIEFKLNKNPKASEYEYASNVSVLTKSPIDVYQFEHPVAAIDVFDPRPGNEPGRAGRASDRVPKNAVRVPGTAAVDGTYAESEGVSARLRAPELHEFATDSGKRQWMRFTMTETDGTRTKYVWLPVEVENGTLQLDVASVTDDGYVRVNARTTNNVQGPVSSKLRNGKRTVVEIPVSSNLTELSTVAATGDADGLSTLGTETATLENGQREPVVTLNTTAIVAESADGISIEVVVGHEILDHSTDGNRTDLSNDPLLSKRAEG